LVAFVCLFSRLLPLGVYPFNRLIFELQFTYMCVWVMTLARLGFKIRVIGQGQGQGLELGLSIDQRP